MISSGFVILVLIAIQINNIQCLNYRPKFSRSQLISSLLENSPKGTSVTKLSDYASDDEGDPITYSLDTVGQSYCNIDSYNGLITTSKTLDREVQDLISFTAYAEDNYQGGGTLRRASIMVFIYVLDVNEWSPEFQGTPYTASIKENAPIDQSVLTVRATDKDDGPNAEIVFQFKTGTQIPQFSLDANSGLIKVSGQLDYEATTRYTLSVVAKDKGDPSLSSETRIIVDVEDVGDNPPVFNPSSKYEVKINENLPLNYKVIKITAVDGDRGINNAIQYQIESDNSHGLFSIDSATGDIKVNGELDREKSSLYQLTIKAYEVPAPSSFALANVTIQLNDVNDFMPTFKNTSFTFTIDEDKPLGFIISQQLTATDGDVTVTNSAFQYSLSGADSSNFAVNSLSGQLTVNGLLDYETQSIYVFMVIAKETLSSEKFSGNATIRIKLNNVNDNPPIFNQSNYIFKVNENAKVGSGIGFVKATDADKGAYGELSYSLTFTSQSGSTIFTINATTGGISLKSKVDYETAASYEFQIFATDGGGNNKKSASANIKVEIIDVNDNDPSFTNLPNKIYVPENKPAGKIYTVKATDRDSGSNGQISFKMINTSVAHFIFDTKTGELNITSPFDYESNIKYFLLSFMANDNGEERRNTTQNLEVVIQDENDFAPFFNQSIFNASIMENAKIGSLVIDLNATDLDSGMNSKITYQIISGNDQNAFAISTSTGEIRTQDLLDRERIDSYELEIRASDHGSQSLSTTTKVAIKVEDYNDNYPNFLQSSYSVKINESVAVGSLILQLKTKDNDIGENARVTYSIVSGNDKGHFQLVNGSGNLTVAKKLDWETMTTYLLNIRAEDHGIVRNSRNTFVTIDIIDDNDNPPIFTESEYNFQIFENTPIDKSVGRVTALDEDGKIPPNMNGIVRYSIENGNRKGTFRIDPILGIIFTNGTVDRERISFYNLTVMAKDGGYPQNSAEINVLITILDVNDNSPTFANKTYNIKVYENAPIGYVISQIRATDEDSGINGKISYAITSGNTGNVFSIKSDGNLTVERNLDRESLQQYHLKINAIDTGSPQRSSDADVIIQLLDVNDNKPVFQGTPYNAGVLEEQTAGINVIQVRATDADIGQNAAVRYNIESTWPQNVFKMNETSGLITTKAILDREVHPLYKINISAMDDGNVKLITYVLVTVTVLDINDHVPIIRNLPNRTRVSEDAPSGTIVFQIDVNDYDDGENARLSYSLVSGDNGQFSVTNDGKIVTKLLLDRETKDSYSIVVNVTDYGAPPLQVSSTLEVTVSDVNDNAPKFVPDPLINPAWYTKTIPEGIASLNKTIFIANATDADQGMNGGIEYSIESGNEKSQFAINLETGEIKVVKMIDREDPSINHNSVGYGVFSLVIKAKDKALIGSKFVTTVVTILISDVNDNHPTFASPFYLAGVTEGASILSPVITVTATDKDILMNSRIKYSIVGGDSNGDFTIINEYVGTISVAKTINAERISLYNLTVMAKDEGNLAGGMALNTTAIVQIHVGDVNDNDPVFNQSVYQASIKENTISRTYVTRVSANDPDQGANGEVWYEIASGNTNNAFEIDNSTGIVYAISPIDRETYSTYTLTIKAEDKGTPISRKSTVDIVIKIDDVNDNPTKFKSADYFGHILENSPPGTQVTMTTAIQFNDADSKTTPATLFLTGVGAEKFSINSSSFAIKSSSNSSFDRETTAIFYLKMTVRDIDGLSSTANLVVVINDVNDNNPTFNVSQSVVTMNENSSIGYDLIRIIAHDKDDGSNAVISYTMLGGDEKFIYNHTSGMIQLKQKVDRESQDHYNLVLVAVDQGKPALEGRTTINVIIGDAIDSAPYFDPTIVNIVVNESLLINSIIYTVKAKDRDLNDVIRYKLTSSHVQEMELIPATGEIKLIKNLNRENISNYEMTFQAIDSNSLKSSVDGLTLRIKILDVNDNAPMFLQPFYLNDVVENTPDGTIVMSVLAVDQDEGENGRITYSIKENLSNLLRIEAEKGLISKYGVWQTTPGGFLNFTVIASDAGKPMKHGSVNCSIRWVAVNAVNPRFNKSLYSIVISEDTKPGTEVIQMTAYKRGKVEPVTYTITGGQGKFSIDSINGVIRVSNPLDRELYDRFAITVTATDNQSPPQIGVTSVTITITDINDNAPKFSSNAYKFSISEDAGQSTVVGVVVAADQDAGNNSKLSYSIQSGNERNWFSINLVNGTIKTIHTLDREEQEEFQLTIMARDHGSNSLNSTALATITILDINDNTPTFAKQIYNISVDENLPGDTQVLLMTATDGDKGRNGTVFYSIISGNELGHFYIGRTTGVIRIAKVLDYETTENFSLKIRAIDDGSSLNRSSIIVVLVHVNDVNDNKPRFQLPAYSFSVEENNPIGYLVGHVSAIDDDTNHNEVFYKIPNIVYNSVFHVSNKNGTITLKQSLDREKVEIYVFTLEAFNKDQNGNESLKSSVEVTVRVLDLNDNIPKFHPPFCCNVSVSENVKVGTNVLRISASDSDSGSNQKIEYHFAHANKFNDFEIDAISGDLKVMKSLDRERIDYYEMIVNAKDHGKPVMSSNTTIRIQILDVNDNAPIFAPLNLTIIPEDTAVGKVVARVNAIDADTGSNGKIVYEILAGNEDGSFTLSPNTGRIKIVNGLDFERQKSYSLQIIARDNGVPSISSITTLNINITNVNDNVPTFTQAKTSASIKENSPVGTSIMTISASDSDQDPIYYYIQAGNINLFGINEFSGVLQNLQVLDREITQVYSLTIEATNLQKANNVARSKRDVGSLKNNAASNPFSTQQVIIQVADENDNPPKFTQKEYRAGVSENAKYGTSILQVVAIDFDVGDNSNISYSVIESGNSNSKMFDVERKSGWIKSAKSFVGKVGQNFQLKIVAEDNDGKQPNHNDTTFVNIFVLTDNQRVVLTMKVPPQTVRDNINEIIQVLQNITSLKINIDEIQYSSKNGEYVTTSTDLVFHAVDPRTNKIQEKDVVISAIEKNEAKYQAFFQKWKVQSVKAVVLPTSEPLQDDTQTILIAVAAALFLIIVGFVFAIYHIRRKQKRKLKAATASAKDSDATVELEHMHKLRNIVQGSAAGSRNENSQMQKSIKKASERFYPMWVEPKDDHFDSASSSASYYEENKSMNNVSNTRTMTTEIIMMSDPYLGETEVDYYADADDDDIYQSEDFSDMFDSQTDDDIDRSSELIIAPVQTHSKEELLLRASLQPMATLELDGVNVTSI